MARHLERFYNQRRRRSRFVRMGMFGPDIRVSPGTAIATPVTDAQGDELVTLVVEFESLGGVPDGVLFETSATVSLLFAAGDLRITTAAGDTADFTPDDNLASGKHTYVVVFGPDNDRVACYVDGRIVIDVTRTHAEWANATDDWEVLDAATNLGILGDLEVYLGRAPAIF